MRGSGALRKIALGALGLYLLAVAGFTLYAQTGYVDSLPTAYLTRPGPGEISFTLAETGTVEDGKLHYSHQLGKGLPNDVIVPGLKAQYTGEDGQQGEGEVLSIRRERGTCEVQTGLLRVTVKISDLYTPAQKRAEKGDVVRVTRDLAPRPTVKRECNLIGMTTTEGVKEAEDFLDAAVVSNLQEVRIVHGYGTGKLRAAVQEMLRRHPRVESFRPGKYGEGEGGVTIVTLK